MINTPPGLHVKYHSYDIDSQPGHLVDNGNLNARLFKIYLHATTSHCLVDLLTGRTSTEVALQDLASGTNNSPPKALRTPDVAKTAPDGSWALWSTLASPDSNPQFWSEFGNPTNFYTRVERSNWLSFTVTLKDPSFMGKV
ncbi:hypothetical protein LARI1_G002010 [Lachnellula arida]|uniref:Uncharacterized protein n=1 Tax=Lachnellula arida TaxID=1316785 RepID=A0A8T9BGE8_9HELO|nr:hypothetical protein LARI1_G002010 [Lachnellula arida]